MKNILKISILFAFMSGCSGEKEALPFKEGEIYFINNCPFIFKNDFYGTSCGNDTLSSRIMNIFTKEDLNMSLYEISKKHGLLFDTLVLGDSSYLHTRFNKDLLHTGRLVLCDDISKEIENHNEFEYEIFNNLNKYIEKSKNFLLHNKYILYEYVIFDFPKRDSLYLIRNLKNYYKYDGYNNDGIFFKSSFEDEKINISISVSSASSDSSLNVIMTNKYVRMVSAIRENF